jgi:hypothetical protein
MTAIIYFGEMLVASLLVFSVNSLNAVAQGDLVGESAETLGCLASQSSVGFIDENGGQGRG